MNKKFISAAALSKKMIAVGCISGALLVSGCSSDDGSPRLKESVDKTIYEASKGVITELEEIQPGNEYKIIDEKLIDDKSKSVAIVHTLEGTTDTLSLQRIKEEKDQPTHRHSGLSSILYYSLARSYFNGNMSNVQPDAQYYKNNDAYNKSLAARTTMQNSATPRTIKAPTAASKGYGASRSFRSYGG